MNGYTLAAVIAACVTTLLVALIWAAVHVNQTKGK